MGERPAHHPDVRADGDRVEPEPLEDARVGGVVEPVAPVEAFLVAVAAVRVLHHELADADQPAARARLVAELGLEVVEDDRQLTVRADDVGEQAGDDFLVGHGDDHVAFAAVLEAGHFGPDRLVATAAPPDVGRMHDRHLHLLPADPVDLLADDLLDPLVDAIAERQQGIQPRTQLPDIAGTDEEAVRRHLRVGGIVAQAREEQLRKTHGAKDSGRAPSPAVRVRRRVVIR